MGGALPSTATRAVMGLAFLAGLAGAPAGARAAPPRCDLAVTVTPAAIPAGSRTARVRVAGSLPDLQLRASVGSLGAPTSLGVDSQVAELTVPSASPPLALVAAVGENVCGFSVVRVGAPAGSPPGGSPLSLVVVEPAASRADRDAEVLVYVFAVDERGGSRRGGPPALRPSVGAIGTVEAVGPGVWRGRWRLPAGEPRATGVEAVFGSEAPAAAALKRMGPPAQLELSRELAGAQSGGRSPFPVLVKIRDAAGNLTEATPEVTSDAGEVGAPLRLERGVYRVLVLAPPGAQARAVLVTARAERAVGSLSLVPSAAAAVRVTQPAPIRVDRSATGQFEILEVSVLDARGQPASEAPVGSGGRGEFRPAFPVGPGRWALPYRPPPVTENATERVLITAGAASTAVDLDLRARRLSIALGLKAGAALAGGSPGPALAAELGAWTPLGRAQLGLVLEVGGWTRSRSGTATVGGGAAAYRTTQRELPILLSLAWSRPVAPRWTLGATAGGGGSLVSSRAQLGGQPAVSESGFAPAASGSLSAGLLVGPGLLFLEARSTWIGDAKLSTVSGTSLNVLALLGYRFDVG